MYLPNVYIKFRENRSLFRKKMWCGKSGTSVWYHLELPDNFSFFKIVFKLTKNKIKSPGEFKTDIPVEN